MLWMPRLAYIALLLAAYYFSPLGISIGKLFHVVWVFGFLLIFNSLFELYFLKIEIFWQDRLSIR
ncbi:hypothetical protein BY457_1572 [Marinilabilia salmonicolor]|jgi:hypothetical protein|nr:hypothetical protein BY457_1572 [Marinilabilia salmonicolor]